MTDSGAAYRRYLPLLTVGDRVAVITPSGPPDPEQLNRGCEALRSWGLHPVLGARVDTGSGMTAGSDSDRVADLEWALTAPDIAAVFCGRGGYGLVRILDHIRWAEVARATPRAVVGFSDISSLHAALSRRVGWASILGVHVAGGLANESDDNPSVAGLRRLLFDGELPVLFTEETRVLRAGVVTRVTLRGGNLSTLASMVGSREGAPPPEQFLAVLEDVNEAPYRVDRMIAQLLRSGWFANAVGVVCGSWEGCHGKRSADPNGGRLDLAPPRTELEEVLLDRLAGIPGPLVFDAPFGHAGLHHPIPIGIPVDLDTSLRMVSFSATSARA